MIELIASVIVPLMTEDGSLPEDELEDVMNDEQLPDMCIHGNDPEECDICNEDNL
jgi:hypothetical protein